MNKVWLSLVALSVPVVLYGTRIIESDLSQYSGGGISACTAIAAAAADDILGDARGLERLGLEDLELFVRRGVKIFQDLGKTQGDPVDAQEVPVQNVVLNEVQVGFVGENPYGPGTGMLTRDDIYRQLAHDHVCALYIRSGATYLLCHKHGRWLFADSHAKSGHSAGSHMILFDSDREIQDFLNRDYRFQPVFGADPRANQFALHVLEPRMSVAPHAAAATAPAPRVHSRSVAEFMQREREIHDTIDSMVTLGELNAASDYLHEGLRLYDRQLSREQKRYVAAALDRISEWMAQLMMAGIRE